ncbi:hypothetical protein B296_00042168 [Ensete ventricosum]|uniref:Uncharacterized protein n=1 Tax=Ensete ventricosum TaxID=4639 RepID=A0A426ZJC9_ENSVE|nr:hypothetical protein B296_00042168 [Ensete ventricosum]
MENHKKSPVRVRFRVTAKKRGCDTSASTAGKRRRRPDCVNSVRKLQRREIGGFPCMARGVASEATEKFRNIQLQVPFNCVTIARDYGLEACSFWECCVCFKVRNSELTEVSRTEFMTPSAFIFLYENHLFLTFRNRTVAVWNFRGELIIPNFVILYLSAVSAVGSINMSNIGTGKCIAKISASDPALQISPQARGKTSRSSIRSNVREALEDVTALFYDEGRNEIYTGNKQGLIHVWSN